MYPFLTRYNTISYRVSYHRNHSSSTHFAYPKYPYPNQLKKVRFDDAPDPIYGVSLRTRRLFPCDGKLAENCDKLESSGKVVNCNQARFRFVLIIVPTTFAIVF